MKPHSIAFYRKQISNYISNETKRVDVFVVVVWGLSLSLALDLLVCVFCLDDITTETDNFIC